MFQGSVLSPLLFVIVLEALSSEFRTGTPWELLYADDLVIVAETENDLRRKLAVWKEKLEKKGLRVNIGKTWEVMIFCGNNLGTLTDSGNFPCGVCRKGVGNNSIYCEGCSYWVHKKCSGIAGALVPNPAYRCSRYQGLERPINGSISERFNLAVGIDLDILGRPQKTWEDCIKNNRKVWKMSRTNPSDRESWKNALRKLSTVQPPGRGTEAL